MRLDRYSAASFNRGASPLIEAVWMLCDALLHSSWLPGSSWRCFLLRLFGARIGKGVVIKPGVRVKFPWRLQVGDFSWIGESVWIDNLADVTIGSHVCISQGAYLCTGSHNWKLETFDLITRPIILKDHSWVGSRAVLAPGSELEMGAVLSMASLGKGCMAPWTIHAGVPAVPVQPRDQSSSK